MSKDLRPLGDEIIQIRTTRIGTIPVVQVWGEVDMSSLEQFAGPVRAQLRARPAHLVLDLRYLDFFGSSGIRVLLEARERAEEARVDLRVVAAGPVVLRPLEMTALAKFFRLYATMSEALAV
jgi:anti-sigma B factor antagonist